MFKQNCDGSHAFPLFTQSLSHLQNSAFPLCQIDDLHQFGGEQLTAQHVQMLGQQPRATVIAPPAPPGTMVWLQGNMYGQPSVVSPAENRSVHFVSAAGQDGAIIPTPQPLFFQKQQQPGSLVYIMATAPMQQPMKVPGPHAPRLQQNFPCAARQLTAQTTTPIYVSDTSDSSAATSEPENRIDVNRVCRHFVKGCCNRRKCRFLHAFEVNGCES